MPSLSDLLSVPPVARVLDGLLAIARMGGFPVASWQTGSIPATLFPGEASTLTDLAASIREIAKGGFLDLAEDAWLDLLCENFFRETRKPATFARHTVKLTAAATAGPYTVPASFYVANADRSKRFSVVAFPNGNTLPLGGTLEITVQAESPGAAYNVTPGTITEQLTPLAGVAVTNPPGTLGSSIVQQGTDREKDPAYRQRCRDKWSTLGSGSNEGAYRYWAASASSEVTRVRVFQDPDNGIVRTVVAGPSGPITAPAFTTVGAVVEAKRPLGIKAATVNAAASLTPVVAVLHVASGADAATALAAARAAVEAYARDTEIAGTVYQSLLVEALQAEGVRSVDVATMYPQGDLALPADTVFVPLFTLAAA